MLTPLDTPTLQKSWGREGENTFALHERRAPLSEEAEGAISDDTRVVSRSRLPTRRQSEVTRPELDPFAEALATAGFLPVDLLTATWSPAEMRYEKENLVRLELLARRFVAKEFSPESEARLRIATERVRRLLPRVTPQDFYTVADRLLKIDAIRKKHERIRKRARLGG